MRTLLALGLTSALLLLGGCRSFVTGQVADALAGTGSGFSSDEDPELVAAAVPFGLKTMESVLVSQPEHRGLLLALSSGFVQYGYAFVDLPADQLAKSDFTRSRQGKERAGRLYLRARGYALRGLEVEHAGIGARLRADAQAAVAALGKDDAPLVYWAAAAWGLAIAANKNDTSLIAELPIVFALADRCAALDPGYGDGAVQELAMTLEAARPEGTVERARQLFQDALARSGGKRAGTYVSFAATFSVKAQDLAEFDALLTKALAVDVEASPENRLANVLMQRHARWLLAHRSDLFLDAEDPGASSSTHLAPDPAALARRAVAE